MSDIDGHPGLSSAGERSMRVVSVIHHDRINRGASGGQREHNAAVGPDGARFCFDGAGWHRFVRVRDVAGTAYGKKKQQRGNGNREGFHDSMAWKRKAGPGTCYYYNERAEQNPHRRYASKHGPISASGQRFSVLWNPDLKQFQLYRERMHGWVFPAIFHKNGPEGQ